MGALKRAALVLPLVALAVILLGLPNVALGRDGSQFRATLIGYEEVPPINSPGIAQFHLTLSSTLTGQFSLQYQGLTSPLQVAHIHFGQERVAGGVMIFLCGGGGQPACPATTSGTITGTISHANVVAIPAQGIQAGDLSSAVQAIRAGVTYANMHTTNFPGGEIRGQVVRGDG